MLIAAGSVSGFAYYARYSHSIEGLPAELQGWSGMDVLVLEDCVLQKSEQPEWREEGDWRETFTPD